MFGILVRGFDILARGFSGLVRVFHILAPVFEILVWGLNLQVRHGHNTSYISINWLESLTC